MRERPILFSAPMVRAILAGSKTQTRSMVKTDAADLAADLAAAHCPYGQPGDRLWVRETWRIGAWHDHRPAVAIDYCDGPRRQWIDVPHTADADGEPFNRLVQQSTEDAIQTLGQRERYAWEPGQSPCRWRPSIHMPRWASRITLAITGVRVERLQNLGAEDALAEGVAQLVRDKLPAQQCGEYDAIDADPVELYSALWDQLHGEGAWDANPWVWVVEFNQKRSGDGH